MNETLEQRLERYNSAGISWEELVYYLHDDNVKIQSLRTRNADLEADNVQLNDFQNSQCAKLLVKTAELEAENSRLREALVNLIQAIDDGDNCYEIVDGEAMGSYMGNAVYPDCEEIEKAKQALSQKAGDKVEGRLRKPATSGPPILIKEKAGDRQLCEDQNGHECTVRETVCAASRGDTCCLVCGKKCEDACEYVFADLEGGDK